ncbi:hypothetical protein ACFX15_007892 [Malus domestica]
MRAVRSKGPFGLVRGSTILRLDAQYISSIRPFLHQDHYYRQYNRPPPLPRASVNPKESFSIRTEGGSMDDKCLILAPSPSLLMSMSQDEMEGSQRQSSFATANTADQDDVLHEDLNSSDG